MTRTLTDKPLTMTVVSDPAQLERLRPAWSDLLERSASNEPMLSPTWLIEWWRVFGSQNGRQLRMTLFQDGDRLVGLAPLLGRRHWYRPGIPFQRLEPLGCGEHETDKVWSEYLNVIVEPSFEVSVARQLTDAVVSGLLGEWDELVFPGMNGESSFAEHFSEALNRRGISVNLGVSDAAAYIALPQSWENYLKALSSSQRYFLTRSLRDFEAWAEGQAEYRCAASPSELEHGKRILILLHGERWAADGRTRAFRSRRFRAFHDAVLPALLAENALELSWLLVRGQPVAALYNILWNNKIYFYQSGRKMNVPAHIRPGAVIHAYAIRRAIEAGRREYDFLGDVSQYKLKLATATRSLAQLRAVRRPESFRERTRALAERGIVQARGVRAALANAGWLGNSQRGRGVIRPPSGKHEDPESKGSLAGPHNVPAV